MSDVLYEIHQFRLLAAFFQDEIQIMTISEGIFSLYISDAVTFLAYQF